MAHYYVSDATIITIGLVDDFCVMVGSVVASLGSLDVVAVAIGSRVTFLNDVSYDMASFNASYMVIVPALLLDLKKKKRRPF